MELISLPRAPNTLSLILALTLVSLTFTPGGAIYGRLMMSDEGKVQSFQCEACDPGRCPELSYCEGTPIKDSCNCCTICSSNKYQPHVSLIGGDECGKVSCPRFKVCVANMQGLPLCKCPSEFLCRSNKRKNKKRAVCGMDGHTYQSKCHMRIASCNQGMMVRKKHKGECTLKDVEEGEAYKKKMRRKLKRRQRKQEKKRKEMSEANAFGTEIETGDSKKKLSTDGVSGSEGRNIGNGDVTSAFGDEKDMSWPSINSQGGALLPNNFGSGALGSPTNGHGDSGRNKKNDDELSFKKKRRRKRKKRKQRKSRKGGKKDRKERRRRRKKRQHRPKSRSKRHRIVYPLLGNDDEARKRAFANAFGHETWWA